MTTVQEIPFQGIPHQSALFLSYVEFSPLALQFYQYAPTIENLERAVRTGSAEPTVRRADLAFILRRQSEAFGCDPATRENIDELEKNGSVAVLTGQQVGIFAGPLYTIYKALTAVQLARTLKERGIRAVPVFWMETEDHDLAEVLARTSLDTNSAIHSVDYGRILYGNAEAPKGSVGSLQFPVNIRDAVRDFLSRLPDSRWKPEIRRQLESTYRPGSTFAQSFGELLSHILRGTGLILFDPHDTEAKRLISGLWQQAVLQSDLIHDALVKRKTELESAGFHAQVSVPENSTVLFFYEGQARRARERRGPDFALKNGSRVFSRDTLLRCAEQTPEKFSPNVLLRPLVQDALFPTVAYVGGSAEVAYFAQIEVLYRIFGRPMPVIWPRDSFTLIEPPIAAEMDRLGIGIQDCFQDKQQLLEKVLRNLGLSKASSGVAELRAILDKGLTDIQPQLQSVDPTLARAAETARRKILHNVGRLKSRVARMEAARDARVTDTVRLLANNCYPNGILQERELSIQHFWARYGPSVLEDIRYSLRPEAFTHHVLCLSERGSEE